MKQVLVSAVLGVRRVLGDLNAADYALILGLIAVMVLAAVTVTGPA